MNRCSRSGCLREGLYVPTLHFWAATMPKPERSHKNSGRMTLNLPVCNQCKLKLQPVNFLSAEGWAEIERQLTDAGKDAPDHDSVSITWLPLRWSTDN